VVVRLQNGSQETVRLIGIDTPESVHPTQPDECFGPEAAAFTRSLLPAGTTVQLELDAEPRDRYGRLLAYVWVGEELVQNWYMINQKLVQSGYAEPLRIAPNVRYATEFERLAGEAQAQGRGLWGGCR